MRAALFGAGVVAKLEEALDVRVPGLHVDGGGPLALPALVDGMHRGVEHLEKRHEAAAHAVIATDERARAAHGRPVDADAAGPFGKARAVRVSLVDAFERVLGDR
ncbi:hypothetical protein D3C78_1733940 [compost metagenome]